jgi:hypothetical protein
MHLEADADLLVCRHQPGQQLLKLCLLLSWQHEVQGEAPLEGAANPAAASSLLLCRLRRCRCRGRGGGQQCLGPLLQRVRLLLLPLLLCLLLRWRLLLLQLRHLLLLQLRLLLLCWILPLCLLRLLGGGDRRGGPSLPAQLLRLVSRQCRWRRRRRCRQLRPQPERGALVCAVMAAVDWQRAGG